MPDCSLTSHIRSAVMRWATTGTSKPSTIVNFADSASTPSDTPGCRKFAFTLRSGSPNRLTAWSTGRTAKSSRALPVRAAANSAPRLFLQRQTAKRSSQKSGFPTLVWNRLRGTSTGRFRTSTLTKSFPTAKTHGIRRCPSSTLKPKTTTPDAFFTRIYTAA